VELKRKTCVFSSSLPRKNAIRTVKKLMLEDKLAKTLVFGLHTFGFSVRLTYR